MDELTPAAISNFLSEVGSQIMTPARLMILGGSALALLGSPRPTLDLDYLGDDLRKDDLQIIIEQLAVTHRMVVDAVPLDHYIPLPENVQIRHIFYQRYGLLDVYIVDPYVIALSKIDRGFDTDIDDIVFLVRRHLVDLDQLAENLEAALTQAVTYDLDPRQARLHLDLVRRRISL